MLPNEHAASFTQIQTSAEQLLGQALGASCVSFGAAVAPVGAWGEREMRRIPLSGQQVLPMLHDEREAPLFADYDNVLVSLTDEDDHAVCVWALPEVGAHVAGIGVDLASIVDFAGERGERFNRLLFSEHEQAFVRAHYADKPEVGFAFAFSAKEAAFKSLAAPLRRWYEAHDTELAFEVRDFELVDGTRERGTLRRGAAQRAINAMGIARIGLHHAELSNLDMVLTIAVASLVG